MKKSILLILVSGSCLVAAAQTPDTLRQQQLNSSYPPDSMLIAPQPAQLQVVPVTTMTDTMYLAPGTPVSTDVRNNQSFTDTINPVISTTPPAATDPNIVVIPVAPMQTGDTMLTTSPAVRVQGTMPAASDTNTVVIPIVPLPSGDTMLPATPAVRLQETMPAAQNMQNNTNSNYSMTRGVNNPDASMVLTGLNKWSALPVLNTYVPQEVVDKLKMAHGDKLYDITMLKTGDNQYGYSARTQENGVYSTVMLNDGAATTIQ